MNKILITGAHGQLGSELSKLLPNALALGSKELDITDKTKVFDFVKNNNIQTIINCAAYTSVDAAENDFERAKAVNTFGPRNLAQTGKALVHISTDYVFDGRKNTPYKPDDKINPLSVYGSTKADGEKEVIMFSPEYVIIRTSWVYSEYGKNFVKTMQRLGAERPEINVVNDQIGSPTYAADLAGTIVKIIPQMDKSTNGLYHFSNIGQCSWYDFACEIMRLSGLNCRVNPIPTSQYPTPATRPMYTVLDKSKIQDVFRIKINPWQLSLAKCIKQMGK